MCSQVLPFQLYTMRDGLASTLVSSVMQDSRGFLWIGTMDGISVFDGREFRNYTLADGLPFSRVNDIIESKKHPGTMWIATNGGGICHFVDGTFSSFRVGSTPISNRVNTLLEDHAGILWCGSDEGLYQRSGDSVVLFHESFSKHSIIQLFEENDSLIWILTESGTFLFS
ncbi:MAG: hypothetical protein HYZ33_05060 [Ignavibacteriales bacterium]|nr:hypothetical protein [Ignavibacteriales bacterium]